MNDAQLAASAETNRLHWDEIIEVHSSDPQLSIDEVVQGSSSISELEQRELGDVAGLTGIHLQSGHGLDTITLARMGARMVGVDISLRACEMASSLARRCGLEIPFIQADVLRREELPSTQFDFVYTTHGVLRWLPSLERWAAVVATLLRPGGWLYLFEIHPLVYRLTKADGNSFVLEGDYFNETPRRKLISTTHFGSAESLNNRSVVHTDWTLGTVISCLLEAGLRLEAFHEHAITSYFRKGLLPRRRDGLWTAETTPPMPLSYSLRASRA